MSHQLPEGRLGKWMFLFAWVIVFIILMVAFGEWESYQLNPNRSVQSNVASDGTVEVMLMRNQFDHYYVTGKLNGLEMTFMLDTGATDVVLSERIARSANLTYGNRQQVNTANGVITVYRTKIDRLEIGDIILRNVSASINPHAPADQLLLGMSALKQLEFTQRGNYLILRQSQH